MLIGFYCELHRFETVLCQNSYIFYRFMVKFGRFLSIYEIGVIGFEHVVNIVGTPIPFLFS